MQSQLGFALRDARHRAGLTQAVLADRVGSSIRSVWQAEQGQGTFTGFLAMVSSLDCVLTGRRLPAGETIGGRLATLRQRRNLSVRGLVGLAGVTAPAIAAIEADKAGHLATVERVAIALDAGLVIHGKGQRVPYIQQVASSSVFQTCRTPTDLLEKLYPLVGGQFDLDPCSPTKSRRIAPVNARQYFTEVDDGLSHPWHGSVFCNPPYKHVKLWIKKAHDEGEAGRAVPVIMLIPFRPNTVAWLSFVAGRADVIALRGRLNFRDVANQSGAPFPMCLVFWNGELIREGMRAAFSDGWHVPPP